MKKRQLQQEGEYERSRWHGQYLTNWAPEYEKVRRSKPQRLVLGVGFRVEVVPALAHGAMGHGLLKLARRARVRSGTRRVEVVRDGQRGRCTRHVAH